MASVLRLVGPLARLLAFGLLLPVGTAAVPGAAWAASFDALHPVFGTAHAVTFDQYSLKVDGQRLPIWSAEFHYFRLPSPGLWRDALEKLKASGFNAVSIYFDWGYHSFAPGEYDFTGVRNVDELLTIAQQVGVYVIARPGPYINAEVDAGGLPDWLPRVAASRNSPGSPAWLGAADQWMSQITPIIARHQITRGGSVIMFQIENEYTGTGAAADTYINNLVDLVHRDGIDVPLSWNNPSGNSPVFDGIVPLGGGDAYPHTAQLLAGCREPSSVTTEPGGAAHRRADAPIMTPEYEGGSLAFWGSPGYDACYRLTAPPVERLDDETLLSEGETITSHYMGYGGTNWGWTGMSSVITSYDWGAALDEALELTPKAYYDKEIGYRETTFPQFAVTVADGTPQGSNSDLLFAQRINPQTKTLFIFLRHSHAQDTTTATTTLSLHLPDGDYPTVPQQPGTPIQVAGQDMKMLIAAADVRHQRLVYSTSEPFLATTIAGRDYVALVGRSGEDGETVFRYSSQPRVTVLDGPVQAQWDAQRGDLRLDYVHAGIERVLITGGGRPSMLLLLADDDGAAQIWLESAGGRPVLLLGPYLVTSATRQGGRLDVVGETSDRMPALGDVGGATATSTWSGNLSQPAPPTGLEVFAGPTVRAVRWSGQQVATVRTPAGSLRGSVPGPPVVRLPALTEWRFHTDTAEADPGFDDASWVRIPAGGDLHADTYGFHHGNVWYRGRFEATGAEAAIRIQARTGGAPAGFMAWLNGQYLGASIDPTTSSYIAADPSVATLPLAGALKPGGENELSILVEDGGHPIFDPVATSAEGAVDQSSPMGLDSVTFVGASPPISWRIQGDQGGARPVGELRGAFNTGGLGGERQGWYLPAYDDARWTPVSLPDSWVTRGVPSGVAWYRTAFDLHLPADADIPLGVRIGDDPLKDYEALIFVNGWMIGRYANLLGPQHLFSAPAGILRPQGQNMIAIAVLSRGPVNTAGLGTVSLQAYGRYGGRAFNRADANDANRGLPHMRARAGRRRRDGQGHEAR